MWELIQANKRRSLVLFIGMAVCLLLLGYFIGAVWMGPDAGIMGIAIAGLVWSFLTIISLTSGSKILLATTGAHRVTPDSYPQLYNVVEEMRIAAGLKAMPKVYIIDDYSLNAFATGISPENCAVAVTAGLLAELNRDELQGVVAHEIGHILNQDVRFMTLAGIMLGSIQLLSYIFLRSFWYSGSSRRFRSSSAGRSAGGGQAVIVLVAILFAILGPLLAQIFYFSISRKREYLADATGVRLTRYPQGLAGALEKIAKWAHKPNHHSNLTKNPVTAPMYISLPPPKKDFWLSGIGQTHPPIYKRIHILKSMAHGANYEDYQNAFQKTFGKKSRLIPASGLQETQPVSIREPSPDQSTGGSKSRHQTIDLMRALNGFSFLYCACGLKMKIPPELKNPNFPCPKCKRPMQIPKAHAPKQTAVPQGAATAEPARVFQKRRGEWGTFFCTCHRTVQLAPNFGAPYIKCAHCGKLTKVTTR